MSNSKAIGEILALVADYSTKHEELRYHQLMEHLGLSKGLFYESTEVTLNRLKERLKELKTTK